MPDDKARGYRILELSGAAATDERAEVIGGPITVLILLLTFGSLVAVGMPLVIAAVSVVGTLALLTALTSVLDVSVFAFNLTTALGFGLAVDSLL